MPQQLLETVYTTDISADDEYISVPDFEDATRTVVRTLGKEFEVDVVFGAAGAKTTESVVILPAQDTSKMMTRKQYAVAQGYANQEAMKCLCTDMGYYDEHMERLEQVGKPLTAAYAETIESLRVEKAGKRLYPGMPNQIGATADYAARDFLDNHLPKEPELINDLKRIGPTALKWRGQQRMGGATPAITEALGKMTKQNLSQLDEWLDKIDRLKTGAKRPGDFDQEVSKEESHKAFDLAERLVYETANPPPPKQKKKGNQKSKDGQGQKSDDKDGSGKGSSKKDKEKDKDGEDEEEKKDKGESEEEKKEEGDGDDGTGSGDDDEENDGGDSEDDGDQDMDVPGVGGGQPQPFKHDMRKLVQACLMDGEAVGEGDASRPVTTCLDLVATRDTESSSVQDLLNDKKGSELYQHITKMVSGKLAVMKRKFERALFTKMDADYQSGQRRGKLDIRKKGVEIMKGRENVYRKKEDGQDIDTAVTILVDASGSMQGTKMQLATAVCTALAQCLNSTPVKLEILAFSECTFSDAFSGPVVDAYNQIVDTARNMPKNQIFHRAGPIVTLVVKSFEDSLRDATRSLGNMQRWGFGANADGDSILVAAQRLLAVPTKKRIMMVLSDGRPAYSTWYGNTYEHTRKCVNYCTKKGINMIGIGILDDCVKQFYKNYAVVESINDLDKAVMDKLAKMILGEDFKVDNADVLKVA